MRGQSVVRACIAAPIDSPLLEPLPMLPTYVLARDHLQRAVTILQGADSQSRQIRYIIERTITLIDDFEPEAVAPATNILDLTAFRERRSVLD